MRHRLTSRLFKLKLNSRLRNLLPVICKPEAIFQIETSLARPNNRNSSSLRQIEIINPSITKEFKNPAVHRQGLIVVRDVLVVIIFCIRFLLLQLGQFHLQYGTIVIGVLSYRSSFSSLYLHSHHYYSRIFLVLSKYFLSVRLFGIAHKFSIGYKFVDCCSLFNNSIFSERKSPTRFGNMPWVRCRDGTTNYLP